MASVSNDTATDPLRIAIARTLGLCCDPDVIAGVVFWPPVVFDWNPEGPEKTQAALTPTPSGQVPRRTCIVGFALDPQSKRTERYR